MRIRGGAAVLALLTCVVVIAVPGALAGRQGVRAASASCADAQTTLAMTTCLSGALRRADRELNAVYARLRSSPRMDRAELTSAQRSWVAFKTKDCAFAANRFSGGTAAPVERLACQLKQTRRRLIDLRGYARQLDR